MGLSRIRSPALQCPEPPAVTLPVMGTSIAAGLERQWKIRALALHLHHVQLLMSRVEWARPWGTHTFAFSGSESKRHVVHRDGLNAADHFQRQARPLLQGV